ncbi:helix-turn-helix domain-containing protein [Methylophaga pinxianii]|uniref:helix-turn-helix domain-containing protein n=1 Tax=Methylophaga pinxianii TaxID=2881052 RepID=UPI001CF14BE7|nr:helix-turn-helix transcriptional regulator [Methylophaga pinxianii]MCB2427676.1 helix-turn-helix domain-containing protein [Methylophaga pinxianii]UPH46179.1 helix-turn-helix domain-containing protein [Methylophaga pinxianii]
MDINKAFGKALKAFRLANGLTQEDFAEVSSRTYISSLERGLKSPTIEKVNEIAGDMGICPLSLMILTYAYFNEVDTMHVIKKAESQLKNTYY